MAREKLTSIEEIRGISFLAIVMQHTLAAFIYEPTLSRAFAVESAFLLLLIRFGVPMFVFITGLVLFYNYGSGPLKYGRVLKKRADQILWPYLVWTVIYFYEFTLKGQELAAIPALLGNLPGLLLRGEGFYHLWFIVMIIQFYLTFPLFKALLAYCRDKIAVLAAAALVCYLVYLWGYNYWLPGIIPSIAHVPVLSDIVTYRDRLFTSWFFYFILGGIAGMYVQQVLAFVRKYIGAAVIVLVGSFAWVYYSVLQSGYVSEAGGHMLNYYLTLPLLPQMVLLILSAMMVLYYLADRVISQKDWLAKAAAWVGKYSLGAYFIHAFILHYLLKYGNRIYQPVEGSMTMVMVYFILCSLLSLLFCYVMSKVYRPVSRLFIGKIR